MENTDRHVIPTTTRAAKEHEARRRQTYLFSRSTAGTTTVQIEKPPLVGGRDPRSKFLELLILGRYNLGSKYFRADFDVRILIGSADMRFQILANGQVVSREHEEIEVVWDPPERRGTDDKIVVQELFGIYQELV